MAWRDSMLEVGCTPFRLMLNTFRLEIARELQPPRCKAEGESGVEGTPFPTQEVG